MSTNGTVFCYLLVGSPSKPWPSSSYIPARIDSIDLRISANPSSPHFALSFPEIDLLSGSLVNPHYLTAMGIPYIQVEWNATSPVDLRTLEARNQLWVGLGSGGSVGWYILGSSPYSTFAVTNSGLVTVDLFTASNDLPWPSSHFDLSNITEVYLRFADGLPGGTVTISRPSVEGISKAAVRSVWVTLANKYDVHTLMLDTSIVSGGVDSYAYVEYSISTLIADGYLRAMMAGPDVSLYQFT